MKFWKLCSVFALAVILGAATNTAISYYYHDPYEGITCSDCPNAFKSKPNPREECRACCSAKCDMQQERDSCLNRCDQLPRQ
jgi:hypothetical protein